MAGNESELPLSEYDFLQGVMCALFFAGIAGCGIAILCDSGESWVVRLLFAGWMVPVGVVVAVPMTIVLIRSRCATKAVREALAERVSSPTLSTATKS